MLAVLGNIILLLFVAYAVRRERRDIKNGVDLKDWLYYARRNGFAPPASKRRRKDGK